MYARQQNWQKKGNKYKDAFQAGFSKEQNLSAWRKVGAAPLTRACLQDEQVRHDVCENNEEDPMSAELRKIQAMNNSSVYFLNSLGYNGNALMAKLQERLTTETVRANVTQLYSSEWLQALAEASMHGQKFLAMGVLHPMVDMAFNAARAW